MKPFPWTLVRVFMQFKPQEPDAMVVAAPTIDSEAIVSQKREAVTKRKRDSRERKMQLVNDGDPAAVRQRDEELQKMRERNDKRRITKGKNAK
jgi:hypothetical protein